VIPPCCQRVARKGQRERERQTEKEWTGERKKPKTERGETQNIDGLLLALKKASHNLSSKTNLITEI
jgi:hypothetical protein